jgi:hypothetical protein
MHVRNVHERVIPAAAARVGALLDGLGLPGDPLWPAHWPPIRFDRPLGAGAVGGHGPIRYTVDHYEPGHRVRFRFMAPPGFDGTHEFTIVPVDAAHVRLRHVIDMRTSGPAVVRWQLVIRPLHDALLEDLLDRAERGVGATPRPRAWSFRVRVLRWILARRRGRRGATAA